MVQKREEAWEKGQNGSERKTGRGQRELQDGASPSEVRGKPIRSKGLGGALENPTR